MYVQLTEAVEFCCSFLLAKICLENCAEVMRLLEDFSVGVEGVQEQLDNFLLDNFVPLMSRADFLSYLSLERLQVGFLPSNLLFYSLQLKFSSFCRSETFIITFHLFLLPVRLLSDVFLMLLVKVLF